MKIVAHKPRSKWHSPRFTVRGISRETLSLILSHAADGIDAERNATGREDYHEGILQLIRTIDKYINADEETRHNPLELPL